MPPIRLFTQPECEASQTARAFLRARGLEFVELDVTASDAALDEMTVRYRSHATPTFVIGDAVVVGFDAEQLEGALSRAGRAPDEAR